MIFKYISIGVVTAISILFYDFLSKNSTYINKKKEITYFVSALVLFLILTHILYENALFGCMRDMGLSKTLNHIPKQRIFGRVYKIGFSSNTARFAANVLVSSSIATFVASILKIALIDIKEKYVYDTTIIYSISLQFLWIILYIVLVAIFGKNVVAVNTLRNIGINTETNGELIQSFSPFIRYITNQKSPLGVTYAITVIKLSLTPIISLSVAFIISFSLYKFSGGMGQGDIGAFLLASMMFNFKGTIAMIMLSFILAGIFAVFYIVYRGYQKKMKLPFVPFIFMSSIILIAGI